MANIQSYLAEIESCENLETLKRCLQRIAENHGFASFNFLDVGNPHVDVPYYMGTTGDQWEQDYKSNKFVHVDHCVQFARRSNLPFIWDDVVLPDPTTGPKSGAKRLVEAANDHGFTNGLVVPFHYRDRVGRTYSSLCAFYWKDSLSRFSFVITHKKIDLHILLIYWVQRAIDIVAETHRTSDSQFSIGRAKLEENPLTDRERDVLAWAARGKTGSETSEILRISEETVTTHLRNATRKLSASNKTNAAVRAAQLGFIDV